MIRRTAPSLIVLLGVACGMSLPAPTHAQQCMATPPWLVVSEAQLPEAVALPPPRVLASPACPDTPGNIVVDGTYDYNHDSVIDADEFQWAVDCLDGDPYQEHELLWESHPGIPSPGQPLGGTR